ncbi:MAG: nuclear transport factor 2 family protein [Gemmatimonadetes bacterium]|nr:nuclear transport factor 2 family protein [Gemmatimonadota bacterium]
MPTDETLERFIAAVESNAHADAIEAFYTAEASMRENNDPPRVGRDALVARERAILARAVTVASTCQRPALRAGDWSAIHWVFRFTWPDGTETVMDEVAWQRWEGERIAEERFFYDPAQRTPRPARTEPDA